MGTTQYEIHPETLNQVEKIRLAALRACMVPHASGYSPWIDLSNREWSKLLHWLDISGLALYFFDSLCSCREDKALPKWVCERLARNQSDNIDRTASMVRDLKNISSHFEQEGLSYAVLKGISLVPLSVPKPWFRSQADIDFLIAEKDAPCARRFLEGQGFYLHAISGRSWEFRTHQIHTATLANMYRTVPFRCVELHLEMEASTGQSLLARTCRLQYEALNVPMLAPVDLFLGQGLHLYKHVCSEFFRAAHVLEFHRHVLARRDDKAFWDELLDLAGHGTAASLKLGVVTLLACRLFESPPPKVFAEWTVDRLPKAAQLWVERYGSRAALQGLPGTKLYLLLQSALEPAGIPLRRAGLRALVPTRIPAVAIAPPHESFPDRLRRLRLQLQFVRVRLRLHSVGGLRYLFARSTWSREVERFSTLEDISHAHSAQNKEVTIH